MGEISTNNETAISTEGNPAYEIQAVALTENKVFLIHTNNTSSYYLYGRICEINEDGSITVGDRTQISTSSNSAHNARITRLSNNKVMICYHSGSNYYFYGVVCTIEGNVITTGTSKQIYSTSGIQYWDVVDLSSSKVFVAFCNSSKMYGIVCTIDGTTITVVSTQTICNDYSRSDIKIIKLTNDRIYIYFSGSSRNIYGMICTISETTVTVGTATQLVTNPISYRNMQSTAVRLLPNKILLIYNKPNTNDTAYIVCIINEYIITTSQETILYTSDKQGILSSINLANNKIFVMAVSTVLIEMIYNIDVETMNIELENTLEYAIGDNTDALTPTAIAKLTDNKIFIAHSFGSNKHVYGAITSIEKLVKLITTSTDDIYGVAKANGTEGNMVDVYRPKEVAV